MPLKFIRVDATSYNVFDDADHVAVFYRDSEGEWVSFCHNGCVDFCAIDHRDLADKLNELNGTAAPAAEHKVDSIICTERAIYKKESQLAAARIVGLERSFAELQAENATLRQQAARTNSILAEIAERLEAVFVDLEPKGG